MLDLYNKENLTAYLSLAEFREDLIVTKNHIIILENQNKRFLESLYFFSSRYQRNNPNATIFDLMPRKNIQFLLPVFFRQMLKNLTQLQSQFTVKDFPEITQTIEDSRKLKTKDEQTIIKNNLDSHIKLVDSLLINFFVSSQSVPSL